MNSEIKTLLKVTAIPVLLLLSAFYFIPIFTKPLPDVARLSLPYLPFIIFFTGITLSIVFHNSREFNLHVLFILIYILLDKFIWNSAVGMNTQLAYLLIAILVPINYFTHFILPERGILNQYGMKRLASMLLQVAVIAYLLTQTSSLTQASFTSKDFLTYQFFVSPFLNKTAISQPILLLILLSGLTFLIHLILKKRVLPASIFVSFIAIITAIHFSKYPQITSIFIIVAQLILIIGVTINAYTLAYIDELTNLPSRRSLNQSISALGKRYTIAMVDIDFFKKFNDKYGHDVGDQVLKKLASNLQNVRSGKAYRYGGEEFTILFPNKDINEARLICEELCKIIENDPFMLRNKKRPKKKQAQKKKTQKKKTVAKKKSVKKEAQAKPLTVTISIGLAERSDAFPEANQVIKQADKALYKAKENGRNQVAF